MSKRKSGHRKDLVSVSVLVPAEKVEAVRHYAARITLQRQPAQREVVMETLRHHRHTLDRFGVRSLSLFGSVVRDEARHDSDIDLIVAFEPGHPSGLFQFVELKHTLEGLLGQPVDLITAT
ncbi:MAG: nucleotidyltransferase domain-containing protein, partial [Rhodospirillales bacterium]|nr:nucleotidyltransferase domain-containing protein [Rhodospirillales bacterium]